jgi:hypothetical protein
MITTKERVDKILSDFYDEINRSVINIFNQKLEVRPIVYGLLMKDSKPVIALLQGLEGFFIEDPNHSMDPEIEEKKHTVLLKIMDELGKKMDLVAIAFACEGWCVVREKGNNKIIDASQAPDKQEIVYINFETYDKAGISHYSIERLPGQEPHLEKLRETGIIPKGDLGASGKLMDLLKSNNDSMIRSLEKMMKNNMN